MHEMDEKQTEKKIARRGDEAKKRGTRTHSMDLGVEKRVVVAAGEVGEEPPEMSDEGAEVGNVS